MCPHGYFGLSRWVSIFCAIFFVIMTPGCGHGTAPIHGKVVFADNKAAATDLSGYVITMESAELKRSATGTVQSDGTFLVSMYEQGDGAMPGTYRVVITPPIATLTSDGPMPKPIIDPKYGQLKTSTLDVMVEPGKNEFILEVERARR